MDTTNFSLLERLKLPVNQRAWSHFVDLYTPMIYSWARQVGLQESDAADLVQEVFAALVEKMPEFAYDRHELPRLAADGDAEQVARPLPAPRAARPHEVSGDADVPDSAADSFGEVEYRQQLVARALELMQAEFQPTTWKACWEFVVTGRPAAEIARELGISENAVHLAKGRVLRRLRQELQGLLDE